MKAEDTVIGNKKLWEISVGNSNWGDEEIWRQIALKQAEISFEAGVREVVKLLKPKYIPSPSSALAGLDVLAIDEDELQANLQVWEVAFKSKGE